MLNSSQIHALQPSEIRPWHEVGDFREIASRLFGLDYHFLDFDGSDRDFTDRLTFRVLALGPYDYRNQARVSDLVFDEVPFAVVIESGKADDYEFLITNDEVMAAAVAFLWSNGRKDNVRGTETEDQREVEVGENAVVAIVNGLPRIVRREFLPAGLGSTVLFDETVLIEHVRMSIDRIGKDVWYEGFRSPAVRGAIIEGIERAVHDDFDVLRVDRVDEESGDWTALLVRTPDDTYGLRIDRWSRLHSIVGIGSCVRMDAIGGPEVFDDLRARSDIKP